MLFPKGWLNSFAEDDSEGRTNREVERELSASVHLSQDGNHQTTNTPFPKVLIISAAKDLIIPSTEGEKLKRHMPEAEYQCWENTGHGVSVSTRRSSTDCWKGYSRKERKRLERAQTPNERDSRMMSSK
ncbi:hypothetical protein V8E55_011716 [Tylopilus felleus]